MMYPIKRPLAVSETEGCKDLRLYMKGNDNDHNGADGLIPLGMRIGLCPEKARSGNPQSLERMALN